jgi:deoxyribose-phosphate aldolase
MRSTDLSKTLDHTVLAPETTREYIERACERARVVHVAAVCASPVYTRVVAERLRGSDVRTCAVIDAPADPDARGQIAIAEQAVCDGADELEVPLNLAALRAGAFGRARDDLMRLVQAVRTRAANDARGQVLVKAIIDAPLLDEAQVRMACKIVADVGADFAMIGSAPGTRVAPEDVELMRESLPDHIGVTALGGVRTVDDVQAMIAAGAARVGTANAVDVLEHIRATERRITP